MPRSVTVLRWEEPPPAKGNANGRGHVGSKYDGLAAELKARPGDWAFIGEDPNRRVLDNLASAINDGRLRCFGPTGDFESCIRSVGGSYRLYARHVGEVAHA